MTYRQIETARQTRLMITEVIVPLAVAAVALDTKYPNLKFKIKDGVIGTKNKVVNKFKKALKKKEA